MLVRERSDLSGPVLTMSRPSRAEAAVSRCRCARLFNRSARMIFAKQFRGYKTVRDDRIVRYVLFLGVCLTGQARQRLTCKLGIGRAAGWFARFKVRRRSLDWLEASAQTFHKISQQPNPVWAMKLRWGRTRSFVVQARRASAVCFPPFNNCRFLATEDV